MAKRKRPSITSRSTSPGKKSRAKIPSTYRSSSSILSKLQTLRDFLKESGCDHFKEDDISKCLRQCGFQVERALEQLITGQFPSSNDSKDSLKEGFKKSMVDLTKDVESNESNESNEINERILKDNIPSTKCEEKSTESTEIKISNNKSKHLLLSKRWIVGCNNSKGGSIAYGEILDLKHSKTGPPIVRFKGKRIEGTLPHTLSRILTPLLRFQHTIVKLSAETLMEDDRIPVGGEVPFSLTVYIENPIAFFELFSATKASKSFSSTLNSRFKKKQSLSQLDEAAFALLQWAQYGPQNTPQFEHSTHSNLKEENVDTQLELTEDVDSSDSSLNKKPVEEQFNAEVTSNNTPKWADDLFSKTNDNPNIDTTNNTDILPEADDPQGLTKDVTLRSYQKQALHWMMERENNFCTKESVNRDLELISDFAALSKHSYISNDDIPDHGIKCDCGPVLVSEEKRISSCSIDGEEHFMNHPLWQRRFLTTEDKEHAITFYVNEYLSIASSKPPNPPKQCQGGILADAMGLGKTVMLIALILSNRVPRHETTNQESKDKVSSDFKCNDEESLCSKIEEKGCTIESLTKTCKNVKETASLPQSQKIFHSSASTLQTTLVVTPLSLLVQWEYEITTKSNLSCFIHYGDSTNKTNKLSQNEASSFFGQYDVVLTSYGTVQMEYISMKSNDIKRSNFLLSQEWKRIILDEAHCIKNPTTAVSKACCSINANKRWVVTGTPIQNSLQDVYGLLKFLKHEPWCEAAFWKATISSVIAEAQNDDEDKSAKGLKLALSRVKRVISPIMLRRTKDMKDKAGNLIITLPPIESQTIEVMFSKAERRLYTLLLNRSQEVFGGYLKNGTAGKSWFAIFSLLSRLRQVCDHISLIVKHKKVNEESIRDKLVNIEATDVKDNDTNDNGIDDKFLRDILMKFNDIENNEKGSTSTFASDVAHTLTQNIQSKSEQIDQECPICLEDISCSDCMLTSCAHMFCRPCLLLHVRKNASIINENDKPQKTVECPMCNEVINVNNIISISKSSTGETCSTFYFRSEKQEKKEESKDESVKEMLETALCGATSSKLISVMDELDKIWEMDPCSKILIFSQFLGFLNVMESSLKSKKIPNYRIDGSMSLKERMEVLDKFNNYQVHPKEKRGSVFLASMKVGGVGINLVAASTVFIVDPWWNAAIEDQCINRIHRIGQNASIVRVRKFIVQDSVEEKIVFLQKRKKDMASEILSGKEEGGAFTDSKPSIEDFKILFGL